MSTIDRESSDEEREIVDTNVYPNPQASEWADERAKFAGFLATLPKMSTGIGESQCSDSNKCIKHSDFAQP